MKYVGCTKRTTCTVHQYECKVNSFHSKSLFHFNVNGDSKNGIKIKKIPQFFKVINQYWLLILLVPSIYSVTQWVALLQCGCTQCWLCFFLLTVTLLDSRGSLSEAGVRSTAHPGALRSAGHAEEILPAGVWTVQLRTQGGRSDLIMFLQQLEDWTQSSVQSSMSECLPTENKYQTICFSPLHF